MHMSTGNAKQHNNSSHGYSKVTRNAIKQKINLEISKFYLK